jgi:enoyl-CoA hydratase/carnithine racemase
MLPSKTVYLEKDRHIAELIMNRPEVLNAHDGQAMREFHEALDEIETSTEIRAVVVTGIGRSFSTGIDLKALSTGQIKIDWFRRFDEAVRRLEQLSALTVAQIRGYAIGGGLQVALGCDLRIATPGARLGLPAVMEALIPGMGTYRLPRFIGLGRARRMILTGELIGAEEGLRIGLLDWVVEEHELKATVRSVIDQVLKGSSTAQALSKQLANASFDASFDAAFEKYLSGQEVALQSEDHSKAMEEYRVRKR